MVNQTPQRGRVSRLRLVIAGVVATVLLGSSFYSAQAGNNGGYNDSLNGLEIAGMAVGGIGAGIVIIDMLKNDDDDEEEASAAKAKSARSGSVEKIRIVSSQSSLTAGDTTAVQVQARYQGRKTWANVTDSASISASGLTQIDGSKNAFAVPYGSKAASGGATIQASFGGQSASTTVAVN